MPTGYAEASCSTACFGTSAASFGCTANPKTVTSSLGTYTSSVFDSGGFSSSFCLSLIHCRRFVKCLYSRG